MVLVGLVIELGLRLWSFYVILASQRLNCCILIHPPPLLVRRKADIDYTSISDHGVVRNCERNFVQRNNQYNLVYKE